MSIFRLIETNLLKAEDEFSDYLKGFSCDIKSGATFMLYSLNTIFKNIDFENIEEGIVDASYRKALLDYSIDAIYLTANNDIITSDEELDDYNEDTKFCFHILQFKKGTGVSQGDLLKFKDGINKLIINNLNESDFEKSTYLHNRVTMFQSIKDTLYEKFSADQISIKLYIVFSGIKSNIEKDPLLMDALEGTVQLLIDNAYKNSSYAIVDAQTLIDLSKQGEEIIDIVEYQKTFKYITEIEDRKKLNGYISILKGSEIASLVKKWQASLFEANIRDYYRRNDLNQKIIDTCSNENEAKNFWSYNNGLTITCRKVEELPNDRYRLYGIQIVNGCQTSNALYTSYNNIERTKVLTQKKENGTITKKEELELEKIHHNILNEQTSVLTKIIETNDVELIYRITETTNSQTPIKSFSLKANDNIQQNIEQYLLQHGFYYERRINFYRNQGKKSPITIMKLFQLFVSQILFKPSQARTRPKSMFTSLYDSVFPALDSGVNYDFLLYLIPVKIDFKINKRIREIVREESPNDYDLMLMNNSKLHMGPMIIHDIIGAYSKQNIVKKKDEINKAIENDEKFKIHFNRGFQNLKKIVQNYAGAKKEVIPATMKKTELDEKIARFINAK